MLFCLANTDKNINDFGTEISQEDMNAVIYAVFPGIEQFYKDEKNQQAFEKWLDSIA